MIKIHKIKINNKKATEKEESSIAEEIKELLDNGVKENIGAEIEVK